MKAALEEIRLSSVSAASFETEPARLSQLREEAVEQFRTLGLPTSRLEEWKYTNLAAIAKHDFRLATLDHSDADAGAFSYAAAVAEIVFVNGRFARQRGTLPEGVRMRPLREAINDPAVANVIGTHTDIATRSMTALNMALVQDGAVIEIESGAVLEGFVHILHIGQPEEEPVMSHPRNLIIAGANSQFAFVESYIGSGTYFTNSVTEIVALENAVIDHTRIECESLGAYHVGSVQVHQERSSSVTSRSYTLGGLLVRCEVYGVLAGEGASLLLEGLFAGTGSQHLDTHTVVDHSVPHCESAQFFKGVLDEKARGVYEGLIIVREGAIKTNSRQVNKNLILSENAVVDSKPMLEIYNDDVKCNHGSTIGQLDEEALFYLRSRGIGEQDARNLLIHAFAGDVVDRVTFEPVREQIRRVLFQTMPDRLPERRGGAR